ncbi:PIN domain-like protein [Lentinula aff. lateritia]|uniref:PIN domain-like protein n=1 Tax=Lentinula aff. lateritia TaxID=2804960 RepID=A0ACC1TX62_9AGAR|nr:PIN domain-like protein [Lentinula aff. lateritia]
MGIKNLWPLMDNTAVVRKLRDYIVEHGFIKEHYGLRTVVIGVDVSSFLDGFRAADRVKGGIHTSASTLTQFFKFLCGLSQAGAHCIFVFDGDERPQIKRGRQVVTHEIDYQKNSKAMIKAFGYHSHTAPGEAEAELVDMLKQGVIDTVLKDGSRKWEELDVHVYDTDSMREYLGYSQGGLILIALLLHNNFGRGVNGIGRQTAHALAQCGFSDDLLDVNRRFAAMPERLSQAFRKLNNDMAYEIEYNKKGKMGSCSHSRAKILRDSDFPTIEDLQVLDSFLRPVTSSSRELQLVPLSLRLPTLPDIGGILAFCNLHFSWSAKLTSEHFHNDLWPGVLIRMLSSKYIAYSAASSEILVPRLQSHFDRDSRGDLYVPTLSATILNKNLLDFQAKGVDDVISVRFSTAFLVQLMGHDIDAARSRKIDVPVVMIAVAMNRLDKVINLSSLLGPRPSIQFNQDSTSAAFGLKRKQCTPSMVASSSTVKRSRPGIQYLGVVELTDSEDDCV